MDRYCQRHVPIRSLANLGLLNLLQEIYTEVIVPPAVEEELRFPPVGQVAVNLDELSFVKIQRPSDVAQVERFFESLDRGESEALAIAMELSANLVLIDEFDGRAMAKRSGLATIGILGVLIEAKNRGLVMERASLLDQLRDQYRFFMSGKLRAQVLRSVGEIP